MPAPMMAIVRTTRNLPFIGSLLESKTGHENFAFEGRPEVRVAAAMKDQGSRTGGAMQRYDLPHDNPVVSTLVDGIRRTADGRRAAIEPPATLPLEPLERRRRRLLPPAGEIRGEVLLLLAEDVHREALHAVDDLAGFRGLAHAEQYERRIERHRRKRVDGQRADRAVHLGRDDRHARGELADRLAEHARIDHETGVCCFFSTTLTSSGLIRSGTVHPFRSYSAMHFSANPLYFALAPVRSDTISVSKRMLSWLPK